MKHLSYSGKHFDYISEETKLGNQDIVYVDCERKVLVLNIVVALSPSTSVTTIKAAQLEFVAN